MHSSLLLVGLTGFANALVSEPQTSTDVPGYTTTALNNAAIRAPNDCNSKGSYITVKSFPADSPFDAKRCAQACKDETQFNLDHLNGRAICRFFNYYLSLKNGEPVEQICALYTQAWDASYADETGQWRGDDHYTISDSYSYASTTDAFVAPVCPSDLTQLGLPENLEFCASYVGYVPPVETSNVAATVSTVALATITETSTTTPPSVTVTSTVISSGETILVVATETKVVTETVMAAAKKRSLTTPDLVSNWAPEKISAACSKVATFTRTTTLITATETVYTATETSTTTQVDVALAPTTTLITTSPFLKTIEITATTLATSQKSFRTKQKLARAQKQNRPIPQWIRLRTGNTIRYNAKRRHWRKTRLGI
ncbi:hypothetical protein G6011_01353 [Alternaria panax]|uniref:Large ribosomal subunit protein eL39 n=1 Tax=Alternaria panax TaxID=48097 RepID=A0AAD4IKI4_9PLEO|nr:hypothetical protein G6011_01353 [Alternaria panax]